MHGRTECWLCGDVIASCRCFACEKVVKYVECEACKNNVIKEDKARSEPESMFKIKETKDCVVGNTLLHEVTFELEDNNATK